MKITDIVINRINRFKTGYVFTYNDFDIPVNKTEALKKTLSRLVASGKIIRLSKGQFYKPEITEFGVLRPPEYQVVKDLLEDNGKIIGYLTGVSAFNKLGLTTQVSNTIQIGTNIDRKSKKRGKYSIRFIRQKNTIYKDNIYMLQILDSIRFIKRIPDSDVTKSCLRIIALIEDLSEINRKSLAKYALKYNPGTKALTGTILDQVSESDITQQLFESLNPVSVFKFNITSDILIHKPKWRIS
jgi:predicted transcriptional regulator of viral defense system